jgi:hypothetical protein
MGSILFFAYPVSVAYMFIRYFYYPTPEITTLHVVTHISILQIVFILLGVAVNIMTAMEDLVPLVNAIKRDMEVVKNGNSLFVFSKIPKNDY